VCKECSVLPICGGGCVHKRLVFHGGAASCTGFCPPCRGHLADYLEAYADIALSREICASLRQSGTQAQGTVPWQPVAGWRIISPQGTEANPIPGVQAQDSAESHRAIF
jgi:hypothetical protein